MSRTFTCLVSGSTFIAILFIDILPISAQEKQETKQWMGRLGNASVISQGDLRSILQKHKKWMEPEGGEGRRVNRPFTGLPE